MRNFFPRRMMLKWFKYIIGFAVLFFLGWYLARHWQEISELFKLNIYQLSAIYIVSFFGIVINALVLIIVLRPMGIKPPLGNMILLQNACLLLNYVPMKFGTLFFANYLKRHYGLKYSYFATFSVYLTLLISVAAYGAGALVLIFVYGLDNVQKQILTAAFIVGFIVAIAVIFIPLPLPKGTSKLATVFRDFLLSRKTISNDLKVLASATLLLFLNFVLASIRLAIVYHSMAIKLDHTTGFLVLGAISYIVLFFNFTPGALGIREAILGAGAVILGVPLEAGVAAALIDRAIVLSWSFIIGGLCTAYIWFKSPADFKEEIDVAN
ncbi:MAG: lysylphosphatidylglycerol synthase transmembrane domain-containing protein [Phycisphaerales bacterium]